MAKWPKYYVSKIPAKTRGSAKTYSKISIDVSSSASCGESFSKRGRFNEADESQGERDLKDQVDSAIKKHMASCDKCKSK